MGVRAVPKPSVSGGPESIRSLDDVAAGLGVMWIELDGHRFAEISSVAFRAEAREMDQPTIEVDLIGTLEIAYMVGDREVGSVALPAMETGRLAEELDHRTATDAPDVLGAAEAGDAPELVVVGRAVEVEKQTDSPWRLTVELPEGTDLLPAPGGQVSLRYVPVLDQ